MKTNMNCARGGGVAASKKLLAAIAVLAVAFAVFAAIPAVADDSDAAGATYYVGGTGADDQTGNGSADKPFATITKALTAEGVSKIILNGDVSDEQVNVSEGKTVELDLNGNKLSYTGKASDNLKATITNEGTLTISDSSKAGTGVVEAIEGTNTYTSAIANLGTVTINAGTIKVTVNTSNYGYYVINNAGSVTVVGGKIIMDEKLALQDINTSVIKNGNDDLTGTNTDLGNDIKVYDGEKATLTITGGEVVSPTYIKNCENGVVKVTGGKFSVPDVATSNWNQSIFFNYGDLTISGGEFNIETTKNTEKTLGPIWAGIWDSVPSKTVVTGGTFTMDADDVLVYTYVLSNVDDTKMPKSVYGFEISVSSDVAKIVTNIVTIPASQKTLEIPINVDVGGNALDATLVNGGELKFTYDDALVVDDLSRASGNTCVSGKVTIDKMPTGTLVVYKNADVTLPSGTEGTNIVNLGGKIVSNDAAKTPIPATGEEAAVSNYNQLVAALEAADTSGAEVTIKATAAITIPKDALVNISDLVTLNMDTYTLTVANGAKLNNAGTIKGAITVNGKLDNSGTIETASLTVGDETNEATFENSGTVKMSGDGTVNEKAKISNSGTFVKAETAKTDVKISGDGEFENLSNGVVGFAVDTAKVTGVRYTVTMTTDITQTTSFGSLQDVVVPEGQVLTIQRGATLTIQGKLIVNGTLNVEGELIINSASGAELEINGAMNIRSNSGFNGKLTVDGNVAGYAVVSSGAKLAVEEGASVVVTNGALVVKGELDMQTGSILNAPATAAPSISYNKTEQPASGIVIAEGGAANLAGIFGNNAAIYNMGAVVLNNGSNTKSVTESSVKIVMGSKDASLKIDSLFLYGASKLTVTDEGLYLKQPTLSSATDNGVKVDASANKLEISGDSATSAKAKYTVFSGSLVITEQVSAKKIDADTTTYTNKMDVAGSMSAAFDLTGEVKASEHSAKVVLTGGSAVDFEPATKYKAFTGGIVVSGDVSVGGYVAVENAGILSVTGTVTQNDTEAVAIKNSGTISVEGKIASTKAKIDNTGTINAAYYVIVNGTGTSKVTYHTYSAFEAAVPAVADAANTSTSKTITILGEVTVKESVEVPKDIQVIFDAKAKLNVGSTDSRDVVLTMAQGSKMTSGSKQVEVFGTLKFVDKTNDSTVKTISDVTVQDEAKNGSRTYTNIYTALNGAQAGETVEVTRTEGSVEITQNIIVKDGVTLKVSDKVSGLYLKDGVTLTIDGILVTDQAITAETKISTVAMNVDGTEKKSSAIIVNGTMKVASDVVFGYGPATADMTTAPIAGAYYEIGDYTIVSTPAIAVAAVKDIIGDISIHGAVTAGDLAFAATTECEKIVVCSDSADVKDMNEKQIITSFTVTSLTLSEKASVVATGALTGEIKNAAGAVALSGITGITVADADEGKLAVSGTVNANVKDASMEISAGAVHLADGFSYVGYAGSDISNYLLVSAEAIVDGTATADLLKVTGTLTVAGKTMNVEKTLQDLGKIDVAAATSTSSAGTLNVVNLYIGMTATNITKGTAGTTGTLNGPFATAATGYVYASAGAVVDDAAKAVLDGMKSTKFVVSGTDWFTVYAVSGSISAPSEAPAKDAILQSWNTKADGSGTKVATSETVAVGKNAELHAVVKTDIYTIIIKADEGIADIYLNGQAMAYGYVTEFGDSDSGTGKSSLYLAYTATVSAGEYKVTYTLKNGWSGDAKLSGDNVSGMSFSVSGDAGDKYFQLTGVEKSGYVQPAEPTDDGDDGLSLTDILLIILVVLIVVMAIIVALRLMRS